LQHLGALVCHIAAAAPLAAVESLESSLDAGFEQVLSDLSRASAEPWHALAVQEFAAVRRDSSAGLDRLRAVLRHSQSDADSHVTSELVRLSREARAALQRPPDASLIERLAFLELPVRLVSAAARLLEADSAVRNVSGKRPSS